MTVPVRIRDDLGVPGSRVQQRDRGTSPSFRCASPIPTRSGCGRSRGRPTAARGEREALAPLFARDGIMRASGRENPNVLSYTPAYRAAFHHINTWLEVARRPQARIEFESADPPTIRRDQYGNALGGIRLPDFAVPTGEHRGNIGGDLHESLPGYSRPFTAAELHVLYPNPEAYLDQWQAALDRGVADGFILPKDAPAMKAVAEKTATAMFPQ